jgi:hypothetical protein
MTSYGWKTGMAARGEPIRESAARHRELTT